MEGERFRKNMLVKSKTTGHIGRIVNIEREHKKIAPLGVEVKWKGESTPATYQYKEDLKKQGGKVSHKKMKYGLFDNETIRRLG